MSVGGNQIISFVTALNDAYDRFLGLAEEFSQFGYDTKLSLNIGGTPFEIIEEPRRREMLAIALFDLNVESATGQESSLTTYLLWHVDRWIIHTGLWVEVDLGGMERLLSFPEREAMTFDDSIAEMGGSIDNLRASKDSVLQWLASSDETDERSVRNNRGSLRSMRLLPAGVKLA